LGDDDTDFFKTLFHNEQIDVSAWKRADEILGQRLGETWTNGDERRKTFVHIVDEGKLTGRMAVIAAVISHYWDDRAAKDPKEKSARMSDEDVDLLGRIAISARYSREDRHLISSVVLMGYYLNASQESVMQMEYKVLRNAKQDGIRYAALRALHYRTIEFDGESLMGYPYDLDD
jgi:hypothetical protein